MSKYLEYSASEIYNKIKDKINSGKENITLTLDGEIDLDEKNLENLWRYMEKDINKKFNKAENLAEGKFLQEEKNYFSENKENIKKDSLEIFKQYYKEFILIQVDRETNLKERNKKISYFIQHFLDAMILSMQLVTHNNTDYKKTLDINSGCFIS